MEGVRSSLIRARQPNANATCETAVQCDATRVQVALGSGSEGNNVSVPPHGPKRARAPQQADFLKSRERAEASAGTTTTHFPKHVERAPQQADFLTTRVANANHQPLRGKIALVAGATRGAGRRHRRCPRRSGRDRRLHRPHHAHRSAPSTTGPRRSRRPPSWSPRLGGTGIADPGRPPRARRRSQQLAERIRADHGHIDVLVNDIWGAEMLKGGPPSGTRRSGSTTSTTACASCAWPSTPTSSRRTTCCRCWSQRRAACWSRSPTAPPTTTRRTTGSRCSTTWPRSR